ncbi:hypothetical protein IP91_02105 [Pseudoduganella lurida]|uniref:Ig-like domain-containing protein n=1 Tax=Pseudoduganella lurida TaxID=1036180 RepID=A0A562RBK0_9BURK|nr:hypothetical protein [Pseudoduganella lurida]TWI66293.1 hypothetical protein IP91_02105 [Pseudoduganella lurida]
MTSTIFTLHGMARLAAATALSLTLSACGGGGSGGGSDTAPPPVTPPAITLAVTSSAPATTVSGKAVTLTASGAGSTTVNWQLAAGSPGSLSAATGESVRYLAPASGATTATATITASAGSATKSVTVTVYPDPGAPRLDIIAGDAGGIGTVDARGTLARFSTLRGVAMEASGGVLVAEDGALRRVTSDASVSTLALNAPADGFQRTSVAPPPSGLQALLVFAEVDRGPGTVLVRRLGGDGQVATLATLTIAPGDDFHLLGTTDGTLYGIQHERIVTISSTGAVATLVGTVTGTAQPAAVDGTARVARFGSINAVASDPQGNLYVIDGTLVREVSPAGTVTTLAGTTVGGPPQDGNGSQARFLAPFGVAVDIQGNLLVLDTMSGSTGTALRKVTQAGAVTSSVLAGEAPAGILGNGNTRVIIVRSAQLDTLNADGTTTPFAGNQPRTGTTVNGTGTAAHIDAATYLMAGDGQGNLYLADTPAANGQGTYPSGLTLRKVTPDGVVSTFLTSALVHRPTGLVSDASGNLYLSEGQAAAFGSPGSGGGAIYKITPQGAIALLAGSGEQTDAKVDGTGSAARFILPSLVGIDADGNLYASDRVSVTGTGAGVPVPYRKITPAGVVTTLEASALPAGLRTVRDADGNAYTIEDRLVYRTTPAGVKTVVAGTAGSSFTYVGALPGKLENPRALVATGPYSFALLSGSAVVRLVVPH